MPSFYLKNCILAESVSIDERTNNASLFNLIEEVTVSRGQVEDFMEQTGADELLNIPLECELLVILDRGQKEGDQLILSLFLEVESPSGKEVLASEIETRFPADTRRLRNTIQFDGIPINPEEAGDYKINIFSDDSKEDLLGETYFELKIEDLSSEE
ncbi:MAG: hypothetical protein ABEJ02_01520 [Candidatus Paceibacteria bacterium]